MINLYKYLYKFLYHFKACLTFSALFTRSDEFQRLALRSIRNRESDSYGIFVVRCYQTLKILI